MAYVLTIAPGGGVNLRGLARVWYGGEDSDELVKLAVVTRLPVYVGPEGGRMNLENDTNHMLVETGEQVTIGDSETVFIVKMLDDGYLRLIFLNTGKDGTTRYVSQLDPSKNRKWRGQS